MSDVGIELISRIVCLVRERERTLKKEAQIRIIADYPSVKGVFVKCSCCSNTRVVIVVHHETVNDQGVNPGSCLVLTEIRFRSSP